MAKHSLTMGACICLFGACGCAEAAGDAARGRLLYEEQCGACHAIDHNVVGPAHKGVYGRKAGSVSNYSYSKAVKSSGLVWTEQTLDQWLTNPEKLIPGQKMDFSLPSPQDRADVIAYLKQQSGPRLAEGIADPPAKRAAPR
jgi:cytochrome c